MFNPKTEFFMLYSHHPKAQINMHGIHHQVLPQLKTFKSSNYHRKTQIKLHCSISFSAEMVCPKQNFPQLWFHHLITQINTCKALNIMFSGKWPYIWAQITSIKQWSSLHFWFKLTAIPFSFHNQNFWCLNPSSKWLTVTCKLLISIIYLILASLGPEVTSVWGLAHTTMSCRNFPLSLLSLLGFGCCSTAAH